MISRASPKTTYDKMTTYKEKSELYGTYPPRLAKSAEFSYIPPRVNPIKPPPPKRFERTLETVEGHWLNEQRTRLMKQLDHYKYHRTYQKAFYGSPAEKEDYRKTMRLTLKQQMDDKQKNESEFLKNKVHESEAAVEYDNKCLQDDADKHNKKYEYLTHFRDENKKLMEQKWGFERETTQMEKQFDHEQLKYNPINWSCTLK